MKTEWKFIGFDLGAESGRCIAAELKGQTITLTEVHRFPSRTVNLQTGLHWDVKAVFDELIIALQKAKAKFGADFDGIGVDTWGVDYALISSDGELISLPSHYRNDRTDGVIEESIKILPKDKVYELAGNQPAQYNTLYQLLAEKKQNPERLSSADKFLLMPDYFNFLLSGKQRGEYSIASTTNLTNPVNRNWSRELIKAFGLPENIFAEIIEPGTVVGTLLPEIAEKTGLNKSIPIIATAGHDTASAVAAIPVDETGSAFLSSGTWSLMGIELDKPILNNKALNCGFTNEGGVNKTTRFLKNIIGLWPIQECKRSWEAEGTDYNYAQLTVLAAKAGPANAWVNLSDERFLKPGNMPQKICSFLSETNQICKDDPGFIIRVIIESLAFTYKKTLNEIEDITGKKIEKLNMTGGGIQNELLTRYTADAIGRKVIAGPVEGAVAGNIGVQALAIGAIPDIKTLRNIVANSFEMKEFEPANAKYYTENEKVYENILTTK